MMVNVIYISIHTIISTHPSILKHSCMLGMQLKLWNEYLKYLLVYESVSSM